MRARNSRCGRAETDRAHRLLTEPGEHTDLSPTSSRPSRPPAPSPDQPARPPPVRDAALARNTCPPESPFLCSGFTCGSWCGSWCNQFELHRAKRSSSLLSFLSGRPFETRFSLSPARSSRAATALQCLSMYRGCPSLPFTALQSSLPSFRDKTTQTVLRSPRWRPPTPRPGRPCGPP